MSCQIYGDSASPDYKKARWYVFGLDNQSYFASQAEIPLNDWTHIVFTYSKSEGEQRIYINGSLDNARPNGGDIAEHSYSWYIGDEGIFEVYAGRYRAFPGLIDDVAVYSHSLSQSEVSSIFENGVLPSYPPTLSFEIQGTDGLVSWPVDAGVFVLYGTTNLASPSAWFPVNIAPMSNNGRWVVPVPITNHPAQFYRLRGN